MGSVIFAKILAQEALLASKIYLLAAACGFGLTLIGLVNGYELVRLAPASKSEPASHDENSFKNRRAPPLPDFKPSNPKLSPLQLSPAMVHRSPDLARRFAAATTKFEIESVRLTRELESNAAESQVMLIDRLNSRTEAARDVSGAVRSLDILIERLRASRQLIGPDSDFASSIATLAMLLREEAEIARREIEQPSAEAATKNVPENIVKLKSEYYVALIQHYENVEDSLKRIRIDVDQVFAQTENQIRKLEDTKFALEGSFSISRSDSATARISAALAEFKEAIVSQRQLVERIQPMAEKLKTGKDSPLPTSGTR